MASAEGLGNTQKRNNAFRVPCKKHHHGVGGKQVKERIHLLVHALVSAAWQGEIFLLYPQTFWARLGRGVSLPIPFNNRVL